MALSQQSGFSPYECYENACRSRTAYPLVIDALGLGNVVVVAPDADDVELVLLALPAGRRGGTVALNMMA